MLSKKLKKFRAERGLTQDELALKLGIKRNTYAQYETDNRTPDYETLKSIADFYQTTTDYLLGKSPFKSQKEAEHSISVAAMKMLLDDDSEDSEIPDLIRNTAALYTREMAFKYTKSSIQYIKTLISKESLSEMELYDLYRFITNGISWPEDFKGSAYFVIQGNFIFCEVDYWNIPRIILDETKSHLKLIEGVNNDPLGFLRKRLISLRKARNYSLNTVAECIGLDIQAYTQIEKGELTPDEDVLFQLTQLYDCTEDYLMGFTDEPEVSILATTYGTPEGGMITVPNLPSLNGVDKSKFLIAPILGTIRGGAPTFAEEEIEGYMYVDPAVAGVSKQDQIYYLRVTGDSMTPKYQPGDLVLIRQQPVVDPGEVAAVLIDNEEACLKKVYANNGDVWLHSTNPSYEPQKIAAARIRILGKAMMRMG